MSARSAPGICRFAIRSLAPGLLFLGLSIASTYPLAWRATTHIPRGTEASATVPLLNMWTLWWNVDRIAHGYRNYWNAPIYYPAPDVFAASEPQTVVGWVAWPLWHVMPTRSATYNLLVILFLSLNGWFSWKLLKRLRLSSTTSLAGGAMLCVLPLVHWQLGILQLISVWGVVWTLDALLGFQRSAGFRTALHLAVAFAITYSLCSYYGLMLSILLIPCAALIFGRQLVQRQVITWGLFAIAVAMLLLAPVVIAQLRFARAHSFAYPRPWIQELSATPADYLRTPRQWLLCMAGKSEATAQYPWPLSAGNLKYVLASFGAVYGLRTRRRRRATLLLAGLGLTAMLLSLGPHLNWNGFSLYDWLAQHYPGLVHVRNVFRFAFFVQIAVVLLAAMGLHAAHVTWKRWPPLGQRHRALEALVLALGVASVCETWPSPPHMYQLPPVAPNDAWVSWLQNQPRCSVRLAFFPLPANNTVAALQPTAEWMYYQTFHGQPMINGYSTFVPKPFRRHRAQLECFPSVRSVEALRELGATHVVIGQHFGGEAARAAMRELGMRRILIDPEAALEIWQITNDAQK